MQKEGISESRLQADCIKWAWNERKQTRFLIFHVPNGGKRGKIEAAMLQGQGVVAGIPDLIFLWKGRAYGIEMKTKKGTQQPNQKRIEKIWKDNDIPYFVCRTPEQFQYTIDKIIYGSDDINNCRG